MIDAAEAMRLHAQGVPFIDVLPRTARPEGLPEGTFWNEPPHLSIPGAAWLYDTGYDRLAPAEQARLAEGLARLSGGRQGCAHGDLLQARLLDELECRQARRALGYRGVIWFPDGVEGWQEQGGSLEPASPAGP